MVVQHQIPQEDQRTQQQKQQRTGSLRRRLAQQIPDGEQHTQKNNRTQQYPGRIQTGSAAEQDGQIGCHSGEKAGGRAVPQFHRTADPLANGRKRLQKRIFPRHKGSGCPFHKECPRICPAPAEPAPQNRQQTAPQGPEPSLLRPHRRYQKQRQQKRGGFGGQKIKERRCCAPGYGEKGQPVVPLCFQYQKQGAEEEGKQEGRLKFHAQAEIPDMYRQQRQQQKQRQIPVSPPEKQCHGQRRRKQDQREPDPPDAGHIGEQVQETDKNGGAVPVAGVVRVGIGILRDRQIQPGVEPQLVPVVVIGVQNGMERLTLPHVPCHVQQDGVGIVVDDAGKPSVFGDGICIGLAVGEGALCKPGGKAGIGNAGTGKQKGEQKRKQHRKHGQMEQHTSHRRYHIHSYKITGIIPWNGRKSKDFRQGDGRAKIWRGEGNSVLTREGRWGIIMLL